MNKVILAYNFTAERLPLLRQVCMMLRVNCKAVPQEEMNDAVGFLAGLKDCAKEAVNPPPLTRKRSYKRHWRKRPKRPAKTRRK